MRKYVLSIAILFVLLAGSAIFLPYLFKDKIIAMVKDEANKNLTATLDFSPNVGINIFKSFPNLNLTLNELSLINGDSTFSNDTFLYTDKLEVSFDLIKFYKEQQYVFKSIALNKPFLHMELANDSTFNWDLLKDTSSSTEESEVLNFELAKVEITDATFDYLDRSSGVDLQLKGLNHQSKGNFNTESFVLEANTEVDEALVVYDGTAYLNNWALTQSGDIEVNLQDGKYSFPDNKLTINGLKALLTGSVALSGDDMVFDLVTSSASSDLNQMLTLIPAVYTSDFGSMQTKGAAKMSAFYKGTMNDRLSPAFDLKLNIDNGYFKYPDLAIPAENINLDLHVFSKDGNVDKTVIDIPKLTFKLANDPFDLKLNMQDIFNSPLIDLAAVGKLNLANLGNLIPLPKMQLDGVLAGDIEVNGRVDDIQNSAIDKFTASGNIQATNLLYQTENMNERLAVRDAQVNLYDQRVSIPKFEGQIGENDINFSGKFDNAFAYVLSDKTLKGNATLTSKKLNINDFLTEGETTEAEAKMTLVEIPGNVEVDLDVSIDQLMYDDLELSSLVGRFGVANQTLNLKDISTQLLGGRLSLSGLYKYDLAKPLASMDIAYSNIKIADLLAKFKVIRVFAPIAEQVQAMTAAKLSFSSELNDDMSPKLKSLNLGGGINLENVVIQKLEVLKGIDQKLGTNHFNINKLKDLMLKFKINDGKLIVSPFDLFIDSSKLSLNGFSFIDGTIDYNGILSIPSSYIKNETAIVNNLTKGTKFSNLQLNPKDYLNLAIKIGGNFKKPDIKLNLKDVKKSLANTVKNAVQNEVEQKKEEAKTAVTNELNKIKDETQKKADEAKARLEADIARKKKETEERLRLEAEAKKNKLKEDAQKKLGDLFKK